MQNYNFAFMILPIVAYGAQVLRKVATPIQPDDENLQALLQNMWETMYNSNGVGLAAPQINKDIRLFIIDSTQIFENLDEEDEGKYADAPGLKQTFINATLISQEGKEWSYNEGCLSIPKVREDITRNEKITIHFFDENFNEHTKSFEGITARVIQHEYDHIEGKLFIDYLSPLKRRLIKNKLEDISKGKIKVDYKMVFPK